MDAGTIIGGFAAVCTTLSSLPQLKKCWETGSAGDLSLRMLLLHSTGVALWIGYGVFRGDWVIIISNAVSLVLLLGILYFKLRETGKRRPERRAIKDRLDHKTHAATGLPSPTSVTRCMTRRTCALSKGSTECIVQRLSHMMTSSFAQTWR
jgi:MtN3 and saliva related transmembrane protein